MPDGYDEIDSGLIQNMIVIVMKPNEPIMQLNAINMLFDVIAFIKVNKITLYSNNGQIKPDLSLHINHSRIITRFKWHKI